MWGFELVYTHLRLLTLDSRPGSNCLFHFHNVPRHSGRGGVDHTAIELRRPPPFPGSLLQRIEDTPCPIHLARRRGKDLVRERDLGGMDGPLAFDTERGGPACGSGVPVGILEVTEGPVDRTETVGATGHHHSRQSSMPLVAGIVGIQAPDVHRPGATAGGIVGHTEMHCLQARTRLRDCLHVGHSQGGLDQHVDPDSVRYGFGFLDLGEQRIYQVDVRRHTDLWNQDGVQAMAGLLHHVDHIAVHVMGIDAIDANADGLAPLPPIVLLQRGDHVESCLRLVPRRDCVFQIQEDVVRFSFECLAEHVRLGPRHRQLAPLKAGAGRLEAGVAHRAAPAVAFLPAAEAGCASGARGGSSRFESGAAVLWKYPCAAATPRPSSTPMPTSRIAISAPAIAPSSISSFRSPRWPIRNSLPAMRARPAPSARLYRRYATSMTSAPLYPAGTMIA